MMRILQWNVWFKESPKNIARELKRFDVDVICAQELIQDSRRGLDAAKYIADSLGYDYFYKVADTWDNNDIKESQGNAIFSRTQIINKKFRYVQDPKHNPPDHSHEGRVYLEAEVKFRDSHLSIGCVHLSYTPKFEITEERKEEIDKLISIVSEKKSRYLLCGDFNSSHDSYAVENIGKQLSNAGPDFGEKTWTTKPFELEGFVENKLNWRIDYVFSTRDIKTVRSEIVETKFSDHLPILVEIE